MLIYTIFNKNDNLNNGIMKFGVRGEGFSAGGIGRRRSIGVRRGMMRAGREKKCLFDIKAVVAACVTSHVSEYIPPHVTLCNVM